MTPTRDFRTRLAELQAEVNLYRKRLAWIAEHGATFERLEEPLPGRPGAVWSVTWFRVGEDGVRRAQTAGFFESVEGAVDSAVR